MQEEWFIPGVFETPLPHSVQRLRVHRLRLLRVVTERMELSMGLLPHTTGAVLAMKTLPVLLLRNQI